MRSESGSRTSRAKPCDSSVQVRCLIGVQLGALLLVDLGQLAQLRDLRDVRSLFRVHLGQGLVEHVEHALGHRYIGQQRRPVVDLRLLDGLRRA